ncbi:MAG: AMP-binding protein, partial [Pseudomonadota bacterium]
MEPLPDAIVGDLDQCVPQHQLDARAAQGAAALTAMGAGEDARVALILRNDLTQLEVMRAAALAGTVIVAVNCHGESDEVAAICNDSGAETVIIHRDLIGRLQPALAGRRVVGVTPAPQLRAAYGIAPKDAERHADIPEWATLVDDS